VRIRRTIQLIVVAIILASFAAAGPASAAAPTTRTAASAAASTWLVKTTASGPIYAQRSAVTRSSGTSMLDARSSSGVSALAAGGCWNIIWMVYQNNLLGQRLWEYKHRTDWCSNGTTVSSTPAVIRWGTIYLTGWSYEPFGAIQKWWGTNHTTYRSWSEGHMTGLCSPFGCENHYPWVDQTVHANGTVSGDAGV
jgi:hypothetical protein